MGFVFIFSDVIIILKILKMILPASLVICNDEFHYDVLVMYVIYSDHIHPVALPVPCPAHPPLLNQAPFTVMSVLLALVAPGFSLSCSRAR